MHMQIVQQFLRLSGRQSMVAQRGRSVLIAHHLFSLLAQRQCAAVLSCIARVWN